MISAIMACDVKGGVAKNGTLPWPKQTEDFKIFKDYTLNRTVIMGSKTWNDPAFPKPLPKRHNVVVTNNLKMIGPHELVSGNPEDILKMRNDDPIIIGGASIFTMFYPFIDVIRLSIFTERYDCDTFIPLNDILYDFHVTSKDTYDNFTHFKLVRR